MGAAGAGALPGWRGALATTAALVVVAGCSHTTAPMDVTPSWTTEPGTRFFLVGSAKPDLPVPPNLVGVVLASVRGGLGERGHTARTGFATVGEARDAMAAARCDISCVLAELQVVSFSNGGGLAARTLLTGAGDMHVQLTATFTDGAGTPLATGVLQAVPYEDESTTRVDLHLVPTIGPAFAEAITED